MKYAKNPSKKTSIVSYLAIGYGDRRDARRWWCSVRGSDWRRECRCRRPFGRERSPVVSLRLRLRVDTVAANAILAARDSGSGLCGFTGQP
jgi:hypothetical protein